ncbi:MAG: imidazole glycerol-phosphate synthase subunit HisH [Eubacteriales bacterium]|nr:imidazole glycerol-phosphate synthase subunit HisH [Eubacteriales bacterium]MDN5364121.1 imidazole glycerol-phosphate synthase subunit HisH [Eubacteriales bacterium]
MIGIIDYGRGNLRSVEKGFARMGHAARIVTTPEEALQMDGLVLPGVGAFGDAMASLRKAGMVEAIREFIASGRPFLGICLGLQLLFDESEEFGRHQGLGIFPGRVVMFPSDLKVPHMGWNQVELVRECPLFAGIPNGTAFYFVHSYYVRPEKEEITVAVTEYGVRFTSVAARGNVFGIQFHPEKSSTLGLKILDNFGKLVKKC